MPEVSFIEKTEQTQPGFNIGITLGRKPTKGQVGIEIEIEGKSLPHEEDTPSPWGYHIDHSLRGEDNGEYVLNKPLMFGEVPKALDALWERFKEMGSVLDDSNRTSVHVHLNCQEFHLNRMTSLMAMWFALEEPLVEWCGEYRVGNLFCLRAVDAPAMVNHLKKFIKTEGAYQLHEMLRYAGLNPHSLHKFGSLEVRTLRGCSDPKIILDWVQILQRLYDYSAEFPDPREVVAMFSSGGPLSYFDTLLGDKAAVVRQGIGWDNNKLSQAMFRGIRFAQDLCYCRDWSQYKAIDLKPDPFGRDSRKLAKKIAAVATSDPAAPHQGEPVFEDEYPQDVVMPEHPAPSGWASPPSNPATHSLNHYIQQMQGLQSFIQSDAGTPLNNPSDYWTDN